MVCQGEMMCSGTMWSGTMDGYSVYYGDDNARVILGMMIAAAAQHTDRYDKRLLNIILISGSAEYMVFNQTVSTRIHW